MTTRQKVLAAVTTAMLVLTGMNALVQAVSTLTEYGCSAAGGRAGARPPGEPSRN